MPEEQQKEVLEVEGLQTYWDLTEKERAELTNEEFERYCQVELMRLGIVVPEHPVPPDTSEIKIRGETCYGIEYGGKYGREKMKIVFRSMEEAQTLASLSPMVIVHDYSSGDQLELTEPALKMAIFCQDYPTREQVEAHAATLKRQKVVHDQYTSACTEYRKAVEKASEALVKIQEDRESVLQIKRENEQIARWYEHYMDLFIDDAKIAFRFLAHACGEAKVLDAFAWLGMELPEGLDDESKEVKEA